ncbi:MAG: hypothetical protein QOC57_2545 [Ilumatobacteraceae bacterium]
MMRSLRRLFWLGLLAGVGLAVSRIVTRRQSLAGGAPSSTPTAATRPTSPASGPPTAATPRATAPSERWVASVSGECPAGYPIKANDKSRIFHVPGGRFYDRTVAERCYATQDDAVADGYRPAKA